MITPFLIAALEAGSAGTACEVDSRWLARRAEPLNQQMELNLSVGQVRLVVGEPLEVTLVLRNTGEKDVRGHFESLVPPTRDLRIEFRKDGTPFKPLDRGQHSLHALRSTVALGAGRTVSGRMALAVDRGSSEVILAAPGRYEFRATFCETYDLNSLVQSNVVVVEVEAARDGHLDAWREYSFETAQFAAAPREYPSGENLLRRGLDFVERFPDSPWAPSVRRGLLTDLGRWIRRHPAGTDGLSKEMRERFDGLREAARTRSEKRWDGSLVQ